MLFIDASSPEHSELGDFLFDLYYHTDLPDVLNREERFGYPNNGGKHTLRLHMEPEDVQTWLALVLEHYESRGGEWPERARLFAEHIRRQMN